MANWTDSLESKRRSFPPAQSFFRRMRSVESRGSQSARIRLSPGLLEEPITTPLHDPVTGRTVPVALKLRLE